MLSWPMPNGYYCQVAARLGDISLISLDDVIDTKEASITLQSSLFLLGPLLLTWFNFNPIMDK